MFDLREPEHAYLLGFLMGDGTLYAGPGRKGRLSIELAARDAAHLDALAALLPGSRITWRTRATNFATSYESAVLTCCSLTVRGSLMDIGLPAGRKDRSIGPPAEEFSARDFARGLVDADGSLGFTATGKPFVSLVTTSAAMAAWWCELLLARTGARRSARPNTRDGAMNIMVTSDPAVALTRWLYRPGDLALPRKAATALPVADWQRPATMRARSSPRPWTAEDDAVLLAGASSIRQLAQRLGRSESAVSVRLWRLRSGGARGGPG